MKILISGAGIAGTCLAFWLQRHGFAPTLVERAPTLRTGGYVIDFWGAGFDVAERMGLASEILDTGYKVRELRQVDRSGKRVGGLSISVFDRLTQGRYTSLPRGELAACLYRALADGVDTIFDDGIARLTDTAGEIRVDFHHAASRTFDLVIGADGLHSRVRWLVFGDEARYERFLHMKVAAFAVEHYRPRDELAYVIHREIGQQIGRFSMRNDRTMFLFVFADDNPKIPNDLSAQKALLRENFSRSGWECSSILNALERHDELYIDRVSQIRLNQWKQGRVALIGDAAFCVSLLGGQGCALAMVAAYILAGELKRASGDHEAAFDRYEQKLRDFIADKQKAALTFASFFAPRSRLALFLGNQVTKLMNIPLVTELAVGRQIRDRIELPEY